MSLSSMFTPKGFKENLDAATELSSRMTSAQDKETIIALRERLNEFRELIQEYAERIKELEEKLKLKEELRFIDGKYWRLQDDGSKDGPFCQLCKDRDEKLIRFQGQPNQWVCLACTTVLKKIDSEMSDEDRKTVQKWKDEERPLAHTYHT